MNDASVCVLPPLPRAGEGWGEGARRGTFSPRGGEGASPRCTLVGAGPGDPELLTLKAVKAIAAATVLFVDDLVDDAVLVHARPDARIVRVGKRGGCKSTPQAFIHKLLVAAVAEGHTVVRLKGGDPFIFGRGGEEVEHLRAAGIACDVVNGITAGLAAGTALGVPLTHRAHAQGVLFVTGHAQDGGGHHAGNAAKDATDWPALAAAAHAARLTLVIYMGVAAAAAIQRGLLQGLPGDTPAAAVQHATLTRQRHVVTTLAALPAVLAAHGIGSPAILIVGDVLRGIAAVGENPDRAAAGADGDGVPAVTATAASVHSRPQRYGT